MAKESSKKASQEPKEMTDEPKVGIDKYLKRGGHVGATPPKGLKGGEPKAIKRVAGELKHHEGLPASKAHAGLKKGGHVEKKALGGVMAGRPVPMAARAALAKQAAIPALLAARRSGMVPGPAPVMPAGGAMKKGGKVHHKAEGGVSEDKRIGREGKPHGNTRSTTGEVKQAPGGYKKGGKMHHKAAGGIAHTDIDKNVVEHRMVQKKAKGGSVAPFENTKVEEAKQAKGFNTKSGGVEGPGYKSGGHVHAHKKHGHIAHHGGVKVAHHAKGGGVKPFAETKHDTVTGHPGGKKTGEIHEAPAGYKHGGHVAHHHSMSKHHEHEGHEPMHKAHGGEAHGHAHHKHHSHGGHVHGGKVKHHATGGRTAKNCKY